VNERYVETVKDIGKYEAYWRPIHRAVEEKMDINEKRDWTVDPNTRIMRHVELTKA
jgi:hypothetical protein